MDKSRHWSRYELLDGELLVTNAPTAAHQIAVSDLLTVGLLDALPDGGQRFEIIDGMLLALVVRAPVCP